jgi:hypothetical protein
MCSPTTQPTDQSVSLGAKGDSPGSRNRARTNAFLPVAFQRHGDYRGHRAHDYTNGGNGLVADNTREDSPCSIAATGWD